MPLLLRALAGLIVVAAMLAWLWSTGRARAARGLGAAGSDVAAIAIVTWIGAIVTLAAIGLGAFGVLDPFAWAGLAAVLGLGLRGRARSTSEQIPIPDVAGVDARPTRAFALGVTAVVLGRAVYGLRNPPSDVDSMLYHVPMVAHWMASRGLGAAHFQPAEIGSFYPGNVEVLALGFAWAVGRETLMTLPGVLSLGLLALALRRLAIEASARRAVAEVLALALVSAPGVLQLTLGLRVENVMAAWLAVALLFLLRARRTGTAADYEVGLCALGLLAGCKAIGPMLALIVLATALVGRGPRARLRALFASRFGLATLVIAGGFWLVRNALADGNPVYPATARFGPWTLPGLMDHTDLALTSQFARWRSGLPGQLTLANLWRYFGPTGAVLVAGALITAARAMSPRRSGSSRPAIVPLAVVAMAIAALTILQPFSGAGAAEYPGGPLVLSTESARFTLSAVVAMFPLAAVGLSALPLYPVVLVGAALVLVNAIPRAGHLLPAFALAALVGFAWSRMPRAITGAHAWRAGVILAGCAILAGVVAAVEPQRAAETDRLWNAMSARFGGVSTTVARSVIAGAAGRPIAVVGVSTIGMFYGRDLTGRPVYLPVGRSRRESVEWWRDGPDPRDRADEAVWRGNLAESRAAFVVVVTGRRLQPVERTWCEHDTTGLAPVWVTAQQAVFRVVRDPHGPP